MDAERKLNTREAARFLRVSEASIRRWSDSGLLPSGRVGRRRERRFAEADLIAFVEHVPTRNSLGSTVNIGGTALSIPVHLATLFSSDAGGLRLTIPFFAEGIRLGQPCFLVADGSLAERYVEALGQVEGVDLEAAMESDLFSLVVFSGGRVGDAIAQWEGNFATSIARRPTIIRIVGEMVAERTMFASEEEMLRYEEAFEVMSKRYPLAVMCQYDVRRFDGPALLRALKAHPDLFGLRIGTFLN
ncbi:MAG TPA: MEDS domain-containing protein [Candidatus Dormibacteraeota bacterium]|nr:MEDS domain-containing protein [Candidatus Dormibacteraeota bacterium]